MLKQGYKVFVLLSGLIWFLVLDKPDKTNLYFIFMQISSLWCAFGWERYRFGLVSNQRKKPSTSDKYVSFQQIEMPFYNSRLSLSSRSISEFLFSSSPLLLWANLDLHLLQSPVFLSSCLSSLCSVAHPSFGFYLHLLPRILSPLSVNVPHTHTHHSVSMHDWLQNRTSTTVATAMSRSKSHRSCTVHLCVCPCVHVCVWLWQVFATSECMCKYNHLQGR